MDAIYNLMMCCVILHHMIIEDEWTQNLEPLFDEANVAHSKKSLTFQEYMEGTPKSKNSKIHYNFKMNLVEHLWID